MIGYIYLKTESISYANMLLECERRESEASATRMELPLKIYRSLQDYLKLLTIHLIAMKAKVIIGKENFHSTPVMATPS